MDAAILPETLPQWATLIGAMLLTELRHYIPLIRRYFAAKLKKAEAEASTAEKEADSGNERRYQDIDADGSRGSRETPEDEDE